MIVHLIAGELTSGCSDVLCSSVVLMIVEMLSRRARLLGRSLPLPRDEDMPLSSCFVIHLLSMRSLSSSLARARPKSSSLHVSSSEYARPMREASPERLRNCKMEGEVDDCADGLTVGKRRGSQLVGSTCRARRRWRPCHRSDAFVVCTPIGGT